MSRTEALRQAVEHVYTGADTIDAECIQDALADLGFEIVQMSAARAGSKRRTRPDLPTGITKRLPKRRST